MFGGLEDFLFSVSTDCFMNYDRVRSQHYKYGKKIIQIDRSRSKDTRKNKKTGYCTEAKFHAEKSEGAVQGLVSRNLI